VELRSSKNVPPRHAKKGTMMKHVKAGICAILAVLIASGCSAAGDGSTADGVDVGASNSATNSESSGEAAGALLARLEFDDGNVVQFEELDGGVLVTELGALLNSRHLSPKPGVSALELFKTMAPGRAVPTSLLRMHERMYTRGSIEGKAIEGKLGTPSDVSDGKLQTPDQDLEHSGEFEQAYPAANFLSQMCNFPLGNGSYKHTNRTDAHPDISLNVHNAYYAFGSDKGSVKGTACVGKNKGGVFDGKCGNSYVVQAGGAASAYYDAGDTHICSGGAGGVTVCVLNYKRLELRWVKVSTSVNFHECTYINGPE
jgi:hypothetical protein